ncbi:MAG: carbohydrate ABC transporter permease, partial [Thermomicrobiales bacterium]
MAMLQMQTGAEIAAPAPKQQARTRGVIARLWADRWIYLFLLPTATLYTMYTVWPIAASYWYALLDWNGFERDRAFVGLDNFRELARDDLFWNALGNTFLFAAVTVPIRVALALVAAVILNNPRLPFASLFRTALFLPVVTTTAIVGVVMGFVFDPAGGPINLLLLESGLVDRPVNFLGDSSTALYSVMGVHIWKWFGVTLVYWLAALQTINLDLYEAARVDGANAARIFFDITLPLLKPFAVIIFTLTFIDTLEIFDLMLTMTNG